MNKVPFAAEMLLRMEPIYPVFFLGEDQPLVAIIIAGAFALRASTEGRRLHAEWSPARYVAGADVNALVLSTIVAANLVLANFDKISNVLSDSVRLIALLKHGGGVLLILCFGRLMIALGLHRQEIRAFALGRMTSVEETGKQPSLRWQSSGRTRSMSGREKLVVSTIER